METPARYYPKRHIKKGKPKTMKQQMVLLDKRIKKVSAEEEIKSFQYYQTTTNIPVNLYVPVSLLNGLVTGVSDGQRIGNKIYPTSISIRGDIITQVEEPTPVKYRVLVFWDRQANDSTPVIFDSVLVSSGLLIYSANTTPPNAPYNIRLHGRYQILYDETFVSSPQAPAEPIASGTYYAPRYCSFQMKISLDRVIQFLDGAANNVQMNNLWFAIAKDTSTVDASNFFFTAQLLYKDA